MLCHSKPSCQPHRPQDRPLGVSWQERQAGSGAPRPWGCHCQVLRSSNLPRARPRRQPPEDCQWLAPQSLAAPPRAVRQAAEPGSVGRACARCAARHRHPRPGAASAQYLSGGRCAAPHRQRRVTASHRAESAGRPPARPPAFACSMPAGEPRLQASRGSDAYLGPARNTCFPFGLALPYRTHNACAQCIAAP